MFNFLEVNQCFFCGVKIRKNRTHTIEYKAKDGTGSINTCKDCAKDFAQLKEHMGELYDGEL